MTFRCYEERQSKKRRQRIAGPSVAPRSSRSSAIDQDSHLDHSKAPKLENLRTTADGQEEKEAQLRPRRSEDGETADAQTAASTEHQRRGAAGVIQRTYRGHRARRQFGGLSLDASSRWIEAVKEAQYRHMNTPRPRGSSRAQTLDPNASEEPLPPTTSEAHHNWKRIAGITRHAHGDNPVPDESSSDDESSDGNDHSTRAKARRRRRANRREWRGKMMDLPYFLEMVDLEHRYGSNLRAYHEVWKKSDTQENYFYWLDHGEGRNVDLDIVSREQLDREHVRYLSREERMQYLVDLDDKGRLVWHRNGELIDTSEEYRDSVQGIVPKDTYAKAWREDELREMQEKYHNTSKLPEEEDHDDTSGSSVDSGADKRYPGPPKYRDAKGPAKVKHVSAASLLDKLLRTSVKKNTWIFVADTSMNLYVGIKQSGAFQHSSFINGARISSAGTIRIKNGQLRSLSPLSGHYRPPTKSFKHFVHHLEDTNVDMSHVSISKSYAVLVGLETYMKAKKESRKVGQRMKEGMENVFQHDKFKARKEVERDKTESTRRENEILEQERRERREGLGISSIRDLPERLKEVGHRRTSGLKDTSDSRENVAREEVKSWDLPAAGGEGASAVT